MYFKKPLMPLMLFQLFRILSILQFFSFDVLFVQFQTTSKVEDIYSVLLLTVRVCTIICTGITTSSFQLQLHEDAQILQCSQIPLLPTRKAQLNLSVKSKALGLTALDLNALARVSATKKSRPVDSYQIELIKEQAWFRSSNIFFSLNNSS